ncbi:MAG TPA: hypothetical protein VMX35_14480 [Acidobacteriota bacterium]|nr:hypothetical protein [Acidobacteriota bacterium]
MGDFEDIDAGLGLGYLLVKLSPPIGKRVIFVAKSVLVDGSCQVEVIYLVRLDGNLFAFCFENPE